MKKLKIGTVALLMVVGSMAWSHRSASLQNQQASKTPEERATAHSTRLTEKLGLNPVQQKASMTFASNAPNKKMLTEPNFKMIRKGCEMLVNKTNRILKQI